MAETLVSVVLPFRNEEKLLPGCLAALLAQDYPLDCLEILAVDNGSTDGSAAVVRSFPKVRYFLQAEGGHAAARNRGIREARGELIALTDADCAAPPDWISRLAARFREEPEVAIAGGAVVSGGTGWIARYQRLRGTGFFDAAGSDAAPAPWLLTGNLMARRDLLLRLGGLDESLGLGEDIDLSWRALMAGHFPRFLPGVVVTERRRRTLRSFHAQNRRAGETAALLSRRFEALHRSCGQGESSGLFRAPARLARKAGSRIRDLLARGGDLPHATRLAHLFLLVSGHLSFQRGRFKGRRRAAREAPLSFETAGHPAGRVLHLSPEDRLLYLASLREGSWREDPELVRQWAAAVRDWETLLARAGRHRLPTRLYLLLKRVGAERAMGEEAWKKLDFVQVSARARVLYMESELQSLVPLLVRSGIEVTLLKGAALCRTVYRERPLRYFVDLDLLVPPGGFEPARAALEDAGYRREEERSPFPTRWHERAAALETRKVSASWGHPERGVSVDLHQDLLERDEVFGPGASWLREGASPVSLGGATALLPDPTRTFTHLLFHAAKHSANEEHVLGWYADLDECLRHFGAQVDGALCRERVEQTHLRGEEARLLAFLRRHFDSPLPAELNLLLEREGAVPAPLERVVRPGRGPDLAGFIGQEGERRRGGFLSSWAEVRGAWNRLLFPVKWLFPAPAYFQSKYGAEGPWQLVAAYPRHWAVTAAKGIALGAYGLRRLWKRN